MKKITNWVRKRGERKVREGIDIEIGEKGAGEEAMEKKKLKHNREEFGKHGLPKGSEE